MVINDDTTLLNYGFLDGGFYTVADITPNCRFFCKVNLDLQEMYDTQDSFLKNGLCDYVVSRKIIDFENYELIAHSTSYKGSQEEIMDYYLYCLKPDTDIKNNP